MSKQDAPAGKLDTQAMLSGVEAIARLLVIRHELDQEAGLQTATLISGYPGSPLGGVDLILEQYKELLDSHRVVHRPGVNEELALAAVWGSQMGAAVAYREVDGVVGAWYGKTPGLDRSGDVLRHANAMGAGPNGGVVLFCGDDPSAKSSTLPCDSQYAFQDACVPLLYPADQQEVVDYGLHAFAMSRLAGPLVGLKVVTAVADGAGTVQLAQAHYRSPPIAELTVDGLPYRHRPLATIGPHQVPDQEWLTNGVRLAAAQAYVRARGLDRVQGASGDEQNPARFGIVTAGKTYFDVMEALADLWGAEPDLARAGIRILKLAMTFPLDEETVVAFARSVETLVVIEEKRPFIEMQLRSALNEARCMVPVVGKRDRAGKPLVSSVGELDVAQIADVLRRLNCIQPLEPPRKAMRRLELKSFPQPPPRPPEYCSGCPHNRSTVVPPDVLVGGGVGCHGIMYFEPRQRGLHKLPPPPMGAEGVPWIGLAPFVSEQHLIQNLGDGTFSHSGLLAIRACVAAGVNMTFKILYNAAVAMTGGQEVAGLLDIPGLTRELHAEGVVRTVVCSEEPGRYGATAHWGTGVKVLGRDELSNVQDELRNVPGVTVIIYDQRCASEARRLRRRGLLETPAAQVIINAAVCEGCGDCRTKSNCASVRPYPTEFGEKRRIDQLTCNRDYTCLEGDCPSFVTITALDPAQEQKAGKVQDSERPRLPAGELTTPPKATLGPRFGVYFTGIGGTGVVTAGRILTAAAELAGLSVSSMDQTGLAQRGGAVVSHLHFARSRADLGAPTIGAGGADLYLSGDIFQAASPQHLSRVRPGRTVAAICSEVTPTAALQQTGQALPDVAMMRSAVTEHVGEPRLVFPDAIRIADQVFSQPVLANIVLLGAAFQLGGLPFSLQEMESALSMRGSAAANLAAFAWGRWSVQDPAAVLEALRLDSAVDLTMQAFEPTPKSAAAADKLLAGQGLPGEVAGLVRRRLSQVIDYQSGALGQRFLRLVSEVASRDSAPRGFALTMAVAESFFRLLTYKDEYEVARLHAATDYARIARGLGITGPYRVKYHLHPPLLRRLGRKRKAPLGWFYAAGFRVLRRLKWLRGTLLDPLRWDPDRRLERALIVEFERLIAEASSRDALPYDVRVAVAASALDIKGYAEIKERNVELWRQRVAALLNNNQSVGEAAE